MINLKGDVAAIIDFEILIGPKLLDIAIFYTEFGNNEFFNEILIGYGD